ncbi:MAG: hypothetical protein RQ826_11700 [Xanthomonadales bacterium]|nr:hypothetical protein [Xanthomonadales bacterium]
MSALHDLLEQLRAGANPALGPTDLDLLLAWLTGSFGRDGNGGHGEGGDGGGRGKEERHGALPRPEDDPVLLRMALFRLDETLFDNGRLDLQAAGFDPEQPASTRRSRFRRLASAFHPDRFPDLADWLTQRSQAIHQAYGLFKQDPEGSAFATPQPGRAQSTDTRTVFRKPRAGARNRPLERFAVRLRRRFGQDRFLAHKIIAALAILALLPIINLWLVPDRDFSTPDPTGGEAARSAQDLNDDARAAGAAPVDRDEAARLALASHESMAGRGGRQEDVPADARTGAEAGAQSGVRAGAQADARTGAEAGERGDRQSDDEASALLIAARRAMNPRSDGLSEPTPLPTVDEQLRSMGLRTDTERLYGQAASGETQEAQEVSARSGHPHLGARSGHPRLGHPRLARGQ